MTAMTDSDKRALRLNCTRWLSLDPPRSAADWVAAMAASSHLDLGLDAYSGGPAIELLERRVADLLGKPAGLWFPKGIVAQQAALLAHAAQRGRDVIALHPRSHLALDEGDALSRLAGLTMARIGGTHRHFDVADIERLAEPLAAVTVEVPLRRAGYIAPAWDELAAISTWSRERGVPFHLDGARLWEVQPWYGRPLSEIAGLADSVYVSLYKGLGGIAGCVLAGSEALIAAARPWRLRYGGDLPLAFPLIVTALDGLATTLPRMGEYHRHALALAQAIDGTPGARVFPAPPHCNSFQVHFAAPPEAMETAALAHARQTGEWTFGRFEAGPLPGTAFGEVAVAAASLAWTPAQAAQAVAALRQRAAELGGNR
ncbi:MAG TPA: beta-eliminating lyase-related protein [Caulobacteraceae bacterium]|nr:beta-eliminating lyase-related protein [Caulobacteraceae bacterium]